MNCDWVKENITLYLYGELADDARHEVEQHIARCPACAAELAEQQEFQTQMNALPVEEPSASFLAASRMRLQEALEQVQPHRSWYQRFAFDPTAWLRQVKFSPALATAIFMIGFGGGLGAMYKAMHNGNSVTPEIHQEAAISGITSLERDSATNNVRMQYDRVLPESVQGTVDDPKVKEMLVNAARSNDNSGVRLNSVDALASKADDSKVREVLTYAGRKS